MDICIVTLEVSLVAHQASFLCMLQIEPMPFGYLAIYCLFYPVDRVYYFIAPSFLHDVDCPLKFGIDNPDKQKSFFLQSRDRNLFDGLIPQAGILDGDSSGWL